MRLLYCYRIVTTFSNPTIIKLTLIRPIYCTSRLYQHLLWCQSILMTKLGSFRRTYQLIWIIHNQIPHKILINIILDHHFAFVAVTGGSKRAAEEPLRQTSTRVSAFANVTNETGSSDINGIKRSKLQKLRLSNRKWNGSWRLSSKLQGKNE